MGLLLILFSLCARQVSGFNVVCATKHEAVGAVEMKGRMEKMRKDGRKKVCGLGSKNFCNLLLFCGAVCALSSVLRAQTKTVQANLTGIPGINNSAIFHEPNFLTGQNKGVVRRGYSKPVGNSRCFRVTEEKQVDGQLVGAGQVWFKQKLNLRQHNKLTFTVFAGANDRGGDGMAFVIHNDPKGFEAHGESGGSLRYAHPGPYYEPGEHIIRPSLAFEIDTHRTTDCVASIQDDPAEDHTALVPNGQRCRAIDGWTYENGRLQNGRVNVPVRYGGGNIENIGVCLAYTVVWQYFTSVDADGDETTTQVIALYVGGVLRIWRELDYINRIFGGESEVYVGFTGATGGATNEQTVCIGRYETSPSAADDTFDVPAGQATALPVIANDQALNGGGRKVFATDITAPPARGTAIVLPGSGQNVQKEILYTPNYGYFGTDTFTYQVCDSPVSGFCYSRCTTAQATVNVGCAEGVLDITTGKDHRCADDLTPTGHARVEVTVEKEQDFLYIEDFSTYRAGAKRGTRTQAIDNSTTSFSNGSENGALVIGIRQNGQNKRLVLNRYGDYRLSYVLTPVNIAADDTLRFAMTFGVVATGYLRMSLTVERRDEDGALQKITAVGATNETLNYNGLYYGGQRVTRVYKIPRSEFGKLPAAGTPATRWGLRIKAKLSAKNYSNDKDMWIDDLIFNFGENKTRQELTGDYNISWYRGELTRDQITASPSPTVLGTGIVRQALEAGEYTVYGVLKTDPACFAGPKTFTIARDRTAPAVDIVPESQVTSCAAPDGQLRAYVDPGDGSQVPPADDSENRATVGATGYAFSWNLFGSTTSISPLPRLKDVTEGRYEVTVTHSASGCFATRSRTVGGNIARPQVDVSEVNHITSCGSANPMGSAKARARVRPEDSWSRDAAVWEFEWFQGRQERGSAKRNSFQNRA